MSIAINSSAIGTLDIVPFHDSRQKTSSGQLHALAPLTGSR
jgi:hypothetical protein